MQCRLHRRESGRRLEHVAETLLARTRSNARVRGQRLCVVPVGVGGPQGQRVFIL